MAMRLLLYVFVVWSSICLRYCASIGGAEKGEGGGFMFQQTTGYLVEQYHDSKGCKGGVNKIVITQLGKCLANLGTKGIAAGGYYTLSYKANGQSFTTLWYLYTDSACTIRDTSRASRRLISHKNLPCYNDYVTQNLTNDANRDFVNSNRGLVTNFYQSTTCQAATLAHSTIYLRNKCVRLTNETVSPYSSLMPIGCTLGNQNAIVKQYTSSNCIGAPVIASLPTPSTPTGNCSNQMQQFCAGNTASPTPSPTSHNSNVQIAI